jgi:hypothetical protein
MEYKYIFRLTTILLLGSFLLSGQSVSSVQPLNYSSATHLASRYSASTTGFTQDLSCSGVIPALDNLRINVFRIAQIGQPSNYVFGVYNGSSFVLYTNNAVYPLVSTVETAVNPFQYELDGYWVYQNSCLVAGLGGIINLLDQTVVELLVGDIINLENGLGTGFSTYTDLSNVPLVSNDLSWNGTSWGSGIAPSTDTDALDVYINSGTVTLSEDAEVHHLFVQSGATLNIAPNTYVKADGVFSNSGTVNIQSDASGYGQLEPASTTGSGTYNIQLYLSNHTNWRHLSSPLGDESFNDVNDLLLFGSSDPANQRNVYYWNSAESSPGSNTATGYLPADFQQDLWDEEKAYTIYVEDTSGPYFTPINNPVTLSGQVLNVGSYTYPINNFNDPNPNDTTGNIEKGWNLIPNPYSANLSVDALLNDYNGDGTQTDNAGTEFPITYKAIHIWNAKLGQYSAYLANGEALEDYRTGQQVPVAAIPPFQAFWVKMTDGDTATQLMLRNAHRKVEESANNYFKQAREKVRLTVFNLNDSTGDQALAVLNSNASVAFDAGDAYKMFSPNKEVPALYFGNNAGPLSISSFPIQEAVTSVPLHFKSAHAGLYAIHSSCQLHLGTVTHVYLKDVFLNKVHALSGTPYFFQHSEQAPEHRFELILATEALDMESNTLDSYSLWVAQNSAHFLVPTSMYNSQVQLNIYSLNGQRLKSFKQKAAAQTSIPLGSLPAGVYIAELLTQTGHITQKFVQP